MIRRFNRLIFILLIVAVSIYLTILNQETVTVRLLPDSPITAQLGIALLSAFVVGMLLMSIIALWFGFQAYMRERATNSRERERQQFYQNVLKARSHQAAEEWEKAEVSWEQAIRKDPTNIISRVELSKAMQVTSNDTKADLHEALKILDVARAKDPKNTEVLFRAAELNLALNNKTSALDNLALIIYETPVKRALVMARDISEDLLRFQDALEYHKKLEAIGHEEPKVFARLKFKQLHHDNQTNKAKLIDELKAFIKRNPDYAPAHEALAETELQMGKTDEAAQSFIKSAKLHYDKKAWQKAARIWIKNHAPEKALSAARAIVNDSNGTVKLEAEIELIRTYIALNMLDEAKKHADGFLNMIKQENAALSKDKMREYLALKGLCYARLGDSKGVTDSLKKICDDEFFLDTYTAKSEEESTDAPAPRLSTP